MEPIKWCHMTRKSNPEPGHKTNRINSFDKAAGDMVSLAISPRTSTGENSEASYTPDFVMLHTEPLNPEATECEDCSVEFGVFMKKFYCECCGKALCAECSLGLRHFDKDDKIAHRICNYCSQKYDHAELENAFIRVLQHRENIVQSLREKINDFQNQKEEKENKLDELEAYSASTREKDYKNVCNLKKALRSLNRDTLKVIREKEENKKFNKEKEMKFHNKTEEIKGIRIRQQQFQAECEEMRRVVSELQERKKKLQDRLIKLVFPPKKIQPVNIQSVAQGALSVSNNCDQANLSQSMMSMESNTSSSSHDAPLIKAESQKKPVISKVRSKKKKSACTIF